MGRRAQLAVGIVWCCAFLCTSAAAPDCGSTNTTEPCTCGEKFFPVNNTCQEWKTLNLSVVVSTSDTVRFSWFVSDFETTDEVSLTIKGVSIGGCSWSDEESNITSPTFDVNNLDSSQLVKFTARAQYDTHNMTDEVTVKELTSPVLPDNLTVKAINETSAFINWTSYTECNPTYLEFTTNGSLASRVEIKVSETVLNNLEPGSNTIISVAAIVTVNSTTKKHSTSRNVTTPPLPPADLIINRRSHDITVTISPPSGRYEYFEIYRFDNGTWMKINETESKATVPNLQPHTDYQLRVCTISNALRSSCLEKNVTTSEFQPGTPQNVVLKNNVLTWAAPTTPNGKILAYEISIRVSCGYMVDARKVNTSNVSDRKWSLPKEYLLPGYNICLMIRAINSHSESAWTGEKCQKTVASKVIADVYANASVVSWYSTTCDGFVVGYFVLIQRRDPNTNTTRGHCLDVSRQLNCTNCNTIMPTKVLEKVTAICFGNNPSHISQRPFGKEKFSVDLSGLTPGDIFRITLLAVTYDFELVNSTRDISVRQVPSSAPTSPELSSISANSLSLTWRVPARPGGLILYYAVWLQAVNSSQCFICNCTNCSGRADFVSITTDGEKELKSATHCPKTTVSCSFSAGKTPPPSVIDDLQPFTNYSLIISAVNSLGPGENVTTQSKTLEAPPDPPTSVTVTSPNSSSLRISWMGPSITRGVLTGYFVLVKNNSDILYQYFTSDLHWTVENLTACSKYSITILAANKAGNSTDSNVEGRTNTSQPPPIHNVTLENVSDSSVRVRWNSVGLLGNCEVSYEIFLLFANNSEILQKTTKKLEWTFSSLEACTDYKVKVKAVAKGWSHRLETNWTFSRKVVTRPGVPSSPRSLECEPINDTSVKCTWQPPQRPNDKCSMIYEVNTSFSSPITINGTTMNFTFPDARYDEQIIVSVTAKTDDGRSPVSQRSFSLGVGSPPPAILTDDVRNAMTKQSHLVDDPTTQIRLFYDFSWFSDKRGKIIKLVFVVGACGSSCADSLTKHGPGSSTENLVTWYESFAGEKKFYVAWVKTLSRRRRKRSASGSYVTIGTNSSCKDDRVCNGPLTSNTNYSFFLRGATSKGFASLGPIWIATKKPPSQVNIGLIIGIIFLVLFLSLGGAGGYFGLRYWRQRHPKNSVGKNQWSTNGLSQAERVDSIEMIPRRAEDVSVADLARMVSEGKAVGVPVDQFQEFVEEMNRDSRLKYTDAFTESKKQAHRNEVGLTTEEAAQQYNRLKNRFANVLPFDQTRVCLSSDDDPNSGMDYINANFVSGYRRRREFIACQGPLPQTVDDFWRMVWEQNVSLIVMLTKTVEKGRSKCENYWPGEENETRVYGDIGVHLVSESVLSAFIVRVMSVVMRGETRQLTHLQMFTWDDFSAPSPEALMTLMQTYRSHLPLPNANKSEAPTVVHCSAGVGRTGTFIALDILVRQLEAGHRLINVNSIIYDMRKQRRLMVQSEKQYIFIHDFLMSYLRLKNMLPTSHSNGSHEKLPSDVEFSHVNNAYIKEDTL